MRVFAALVRDLLLVKLIGDAGINPAKVAFLV